MLQRGERYQAGAWWPAVDQHSLKEGPVKTANLCCPECGHAMTIMNHKISTLGVVSPSVVCSYRPCTWHVWLELKDWAGAHDDVGSSR